MISKLADQHPLVGADARLTTPSAGARRIVLSRRRSSAASADAAPLTSASAMARSSWVLVNPDDAIDRENPTGKYSRQPALVLGSLRAAKKTGQEQLRASP